MYDEANSTFIEDKDMQERLMEANPNSFRKLVRCLLRPQPSVFRVGFWASLDRAQPSCLKKY